MSNCMVVTTIGTRTLRAPHESFYRSTPAEVNAQRALVANPEVITVFGVRELEDPRSVMRRSHRPGENHNPAIQPDQVAVADLNWRYVQAQSLVALHSEPAAIPYDRKMDNTVMAHLVPYLYEKANSEISTGAQLQFKRKHITKLRAEEIHASTSAKRWLLEAMTVANTPQECIAIELGEELDTLYWYEKMFFDVRPIIDRPLKMWMHLFYPAIHGVGTKLYDDVVLKLMAWTGGVSQIAEYVKSPAATTRFAGELHNGLIAKQLAQQVVTAAAGRRVRRDNEDEIIRGMQELAQIGQDGNTGDGNSDLVGHVRALMVGISGSLMMRKSNEFELTGVEPRAAESMAKIWHRGGANMAGGSK